jgi:zinc D-Ala-D-Ala dipeptidase
MFAKNSYKKTYQNLRSRSVKTGGYKTNTFNKYSPRARVVKVSIILGILLIAFLILLGYVIIPKLDFKKAEDVKVEALPTPNPTLNPYEDLFMPNDIVFMDDLNSWVKTDFYGQPVLLKKEPSENGEVIMDIVDRENVIVKGKTPNWYLVLYNKTYGFIEKKFAFQGPIPKVPEVVNEIEVNDLLSGVGKKTHLVNVEEVVPGIKVDMLLAKDDNYLGTKMYPVHICLLQSDTAIKLKKAQTLFARDGYSIVVWDAYRPYSVTVDMYDLFGELSPQIPGTLKGARNNRGSSVDITIVRNDNIPLEMPSEAIVLDESLASRKPSTMSEEAYENLKYMSSIMGQAGFYASQTEWWHFDDADWAYYPVMDSNLFDF